VDQQQQLEYQNSQLTQEIERLKHGGEHESQIQELEHIASDLEARLEKTEKELDEVKQENHYLKTAVEEKTVRKGIPLRIEFHILGL
jgi:hypothetical protein